MGKHTKVKIVDRKKAATARAEEAAAHAKAADARAEAAAAHAKANADYEKLVAEAKAAAKKAGGAFQKQKALCGYLIIFCLRYHACSVKSISSVLKAYGIAINVTRCIRKNKLHTLHQVLPCDEGNQSVFQMDETAGLIIERLHSKHIKLKMTHPELPAVWSAGLVLTHGPEGRYITTIATKGQIIFNIFSNADSSPLTPLFLHYVRCMQRAIGAKIAPSAFGEIPRDFRESLRERALLTC